MSDNQLAIFQDDFQSKYRFFNKNLEDRDEKITNEMLANEERSHTDQKINEMFFDGMGGGLDELVGLYAEDLEKIHEETKDDVLKAEDLKAEEEDPYDLKGFKEEETVFERRVSQTTLERDPFTGNAKPAEHSTSNQYVKTDKSPWTFGNSDYRSTGTTSSYFDRTSTTSSTNATPKPGDEVSFDTQLPKASQSVQDVVAKNKPVVNNNKDEGWGAFGKKTVFQRIKGWFKSNQGRVTIKTGLLIALQLGIAYIGKRYEYEGVGKMAMHVGLLLGTYMVSSELRKEGMDMRGFAI